MPRANMHPQAILLSKIWRAIFGSQIRSRHAGPFNLALIAWRSRLGSNEREATSIHSVFLAVIPVRMMQVSPAAPGPDGASAALTSIVYFLFSSTLAVVTTTVLSSILIVLMGIRGSRFKKNALKWK